MSKLEGIFVWDYDDKNGPKAHWVSFKKDNKKLIKNVGTKKLKEMLVDHTQKNQLLNRKEKK